MKEQFETIIGQLIGSHDSEPLTKIPVAEQFHPEEQGDRAIMRNLNAAFLIALSGTSHPLHDKAAEYFDACINQPQWSDIAGFYTQGLKLLVAEIEDATSRDNEFAESLHQLSAWVQDPSHTSNRYETIEKVRSFFFPEGVGLCEDRNEKIEALREKRTITMSRLNRAPIQDPAREILFTANALLTIPSHSKSIDDIELSPSLRDMVAEIIAEDQVFWYDHPIQIGVEPEKNEALYGLRGLDDAAGFEKERGTIPHDARLTCLLSVSVTHRGLQRIAKQYLEEELQKGKGFQHLEVYLFSEVDTARLIDEILAPALGKYLQVKDISPFREMIGVDGEYGRHYTFLKAIAAFWQVFIDPGIRGTFKIDLDQIFPQKELVEQSGASAFEHLTSPLWGAEGIDDHGNTVELGMIAGALVNEKDICDSLFCPDVCFPPDTIKGDEYIFYSSLPQALSTEAEMMTRYTEEPLDGKTHGIQRIHVTGGTCGILVESLRKHRPFTPTFIGRAEDQAYLLSVLFQSSEKNLRYVHKDGLIMRHDKEAFAGEAIEAAYLGKLIGDYVRILLFSSYARALPWPLGKIKELIDPFTGCFVSHIPFTVVYLRFALKAASFFMGEKLKEVQKGVEFVRTGTKRLHNILRELKKEPNPLIERYQREKQVWNHFYDVLDQVEKGIEAGDGFARDLRKRARELVEECKMKC